MTRVIVTLVADDGSELDVDVDGSWKAAQVVEELIRHNFLSALRDPNRSYLLTIADTITEHGTIEEQQTLAEAGVRQRDRLLISVVPHVIPEDASVESSEPVTGETSDPANAESSDPVITETSGDDPETTDRRGEGVNEDNR